MHSKVTIVKPNAINSLKDYNVLILYQPTAVFKAVLTRTNRREVLITGTATDFIF
jgi:hypothetical protein